MKPKKKSKPQALGQESLSYKALFDSMPENFMLVDLIYNEEGKVVDHYYLQINPAFEKLVGKTNEELKGKRAKDVFDKVDDYWLDIFEKVDRIGEPIAYNNLSGEMNRYYTIQTWKLKKGVIAVTFVDVTEQKQQEDQLKKAKEAVDKQIANQYMYKTLFDTMPENFMLIELIYNTNNEAIDFYFLQVNSAIAQLLSKTKAQLINKRAKDVIEKVENYWIATYEKADKTGIPVTYSNISAQLGKHLTIQAWRLKKGIVAVTLVDTTQQKQEETARIKAKEEADKKIIEQAKALSIIKDNEYLMLFESMTEMVVIIELVYDEQDKPIDFYVRSANQSYANFIGKSKEDIIDKKISSLLTTIEDYWFRTFAQVDQTGEPVTFENYGAEFDKYYYVTAWKISKNRIGISLTDITTERRIEKQKADIRLSLDKIRKESNDSQKLANIGSWMFNPKTQIAKWSDEMFNIWGFDIEKGTPDYETIVKCIHRDDQELYHSAVNKAINQSISYRIEFRINMPDESIKIIKAICKVILAEDGSVERLQGITQDITEQKLFEKELVKHERLKAIGEMSASIAHDFNNSLQEMSGNLEILKLQQNFSKDGVDRINSIGFIIRDVASRISALQHFGDSKYDSENNEYANLNTIIKDSISQSRPLWKDKKGKEGLSISITTNFNEIPDIECNLGELKSVIYNLIKNSVEAITKNGEITIETGTKANHVFATFTDTGIGMDEETKLKVFQPFYSTKGFKLGRGLGMSGVYRVVKKHKGDVEIIYSEPNKGTTVMILFPICEKKKIKDSIKNILETKDKKALRVLWVDDDKTIRENASELVELYGHNCDYADTAKSALKLLNQNTYDVVFTDVGMPEISGWQLTYLIRKTFGNTLKIAVVSGWYIDENTKNKHNVDFVLQKPFTAEALEKTLMLI